MTSLAAVGPDAWKSTLEAATKVSSGFALGAFVTAAVVAVIWIGSSKANNRAIPRAAWIVLAIAVIILVGASKLFGEWRSSDEVCEISRCEPFNVSNTKIPKNVVNRRHRFLTNDVAKASFKSVLECQPRKCG